MSNLANNSQYGEGQVLMAVLKRTLPDIVFPCDDFSAGKVRAVLADWDYEENRGWECGAGLAWARRKLAKASEPVLVCGFDEKRHIRQREEGSLLKSRGVAYLRLPCRIGDLRKTIETLHRVQQVSLAPESLCQNIVDFQAELRSDFWHGPLRSMRGNLNGLLTNLSNQQYTKAIHQMNIILDRIDKAKTSLQRLADRFPTDRLPFGVLADMETQVRGMDSPAAQAKVCLESDLPKAIPFLKQIDGILEALDVLIDKIAPKDRKDS